MANNVYIGSRYVPIFDGAWDSSKSYEALTIVTYGNNSYTSKIPVPVGTLPTNTSYWVLTGNYNGQITNLQNQINDINDDINDIELKINNGKVYNVLDYGAKGDGVTDDTAAIQAAITACETHGTVYLPFTGSSYKITSSININKPLSFIGGYSGYEVGMPGITDADVPLINSVAPGYAINVLIFGVTIKNVSIKTNNSGVKLDRITSGTWPRFTVIKNVTIDCTSPTTNTQYGIYSDAAFMSQLDHVLVYNAYTAFHFEGGTSISANNCWSRSCVRGYDMSDLKYSSFISCACDHASDRAYWLYQCKNVSLINCAAEDTHATTTPFAVALISDCEGIDCGLMLTSDNITTNGIYIASSEVVLKNCFSNATFSGGAVVTGDTGARLNVISCTFNNNKKITIGSYNYTYNDVFFTNADFKPLSFKLPNAGYAPATPNEVGSMYIGNDGTINVYVGNNIWKQIQYQS